jgi:hypothetical protein
MFIRLNFFITAKEVISVFHVMIQSTRKPAWKLGLSRTRIREQLDLKDQ